MVALESMTSSVMGIQCAVINIQATSASKLPLSVLPLLPVRKGVRALHPVDVVLFEGILVLYDPDVREMLHMKLFVDTDSDTRLSRRGKAGCYCCRVLMAAVSLSIICSAKRY